MNLIPEKDLPPVGLRVWVQRQSGEKMIARRDYKPDAIFRDPEELHWLNNQDKFIDVPFDPVVKWWYKT